jgi:TorA maturation chaperone TorD
MTSQEKAFLCQLLASLFSPPDEEMAGWIRRGALHSVLNKYADVLGAFGSGLEGFRSEKDGDDIWKELESAYHTFFSGLKGDGICLVESFYKPWSQDLHCPLLFASTKGLLMGDPALHLLTLYQECGLKVEDEFRGRPDHLALELEFLSYLYQEATDMEVRQFIVDHLDWIPFLKEECQRMNVHPFYTDILDILDLFLKQERARLEVK